MASPVRTQLRAGSAMSELDVQVRLGFSTVVTVNEVIGEPLLPRALQETMTPAGRDVARTSTGATGTPTGTAGLVGADSAEVPTRFVAVATNVYVVPLVSPVIVQVLTPSPLSGTV
jgi:hypothetical protein